MAVFSSALITRFTLEAEEAFCREYPCITYRSAITIVSGTSIYALTFNSTISKLTAIRRVTWLGKKLDPFTHRRYRESFLPTSTGTPDSYIFNDVGQQSIKFIPTPNVSIAGATTHLFDTDIPNRVIVEYYLVGDVVTFLIPNYLRRRLLKAYVLKNCFSVEGPGQNLKASAYWESKWNYLKDLYGNLLQDYITSRRHTIIGGVSDDLRYLPTPQLPWSSIGIGVERGE